MLNKANVLSTENFFKKTFIFGLAAAVWGGMNVSSASAQALDEIVVTAQKREESLQEVAGASLSPDRHVARGQRFLFHHLSQPFSASSFRARLIKASALMVAATSSDWFI